MRFIDKQRQSKSDINRERWIETKGTWIYGERKTRKGW